MKYYIIAGEASGDLHGKNLIKEIRKKDSNSNIRVWGGDKMEKEADYLVMHYKNIAFMGFWEVFKNLPKILKAIRFCKKDILEFQPDALVLVDYPGFNLRIAEFASQNKLKVFYYISPQIWAWKKSRVHKIKKYVHKLYVILPFEQEFYKKYQFHVDYVGHPLLDEIKQSNIQQPVNTEGQKKVIALFPGSRKQEISRILPVMLKMKDEFKDFKFSVSRAPSIDSDLYFSLGVKEDELFHGKSYDLMNKAHVALVTSGTATLETALYRVPQVVCYKTSSISYYLARYLVDLKYISLVNLVMDDKVVTELIQADMNTKQLRTELLNILNDTKRKEILDQYEELIRLLGNSGASERVALSIFNTIAVT